MARCAKCNQEVTTGYVLCDRCYKKMDGIKEDSIKEILGDNYDLDRLKELVQADREGRCEDCKWSRQPTEQDYIEIGRDVLSYKDSCVCNFLEPADARWKNDFCSYFEPREE